MTKMGLGKKNLGLVKEIKTIMTEIGIKMTIRQIYYQLVSKHIIENNINSYKNYNRIITKARKQGMIDPFEIVDTSKPLIKNPSWDNLTDFFEAVKKSYKKKVWTNQETYVEVWLEKDALRGIFKPITDIYDNYLAIGRGYQSYTNLIKAVSRFQQREDKEIHILYFGDFDPTGLDIPRNIKETIESFGVNFKFHKIAITKEQIEKYDIPPILTKKTDSRARKFISEHGDNAVELDALNPKVLRELIENSILEHLDKENFQETTKNEITDLEKIQKFIDSYGQRGDD